MLAFHKKVRFQIKTRPSFRQLVYGRHGGYTNIGLAATVMQNGAKTLEWFLRGDARCRKRIVQCSECQMYGRKPESQATIPKNRFEEVLPVMELDRDGRCEQCRKINERS